MKSHNKISLIKKELGIFKIIFNNLFKKKTGKKYQKMLGTRNSALGTGFLFL